MHHLTNENKNKLKNIGKIAVLYGGVSSERDISLKSGNAIINALKSLDLDVVAIDITNKCIKQIINTNFNFAFIALHGTGGEDGKIQAVLDWLNIPYTGSGSLSSAIAMDKEKTKMIWKANDLPVLPSYRLDEDFCADFIIKELGLPLAVKPSQEGSSIGVSKVLNKKSLKRAYSEAKDKHYAKKTNDNNGIYCDTKNIMAEKWSDGIEITAGIVAGHILPLIRVRVNEGFYDYEKKYITGALSYDCPADIPKEKEKEIKVIIKKAADVLDIRDWARIDGILDKSGSFHLLEINTVPGMTETSLIPKAALNAGYSFSDVIANILLSSIKFYGRY